MFEGIVGVYNVAFTPFGLTQYYRYYMSIIRKPGSAIFIGNRWAINTLCHSAIPLPKQKQSRFLLFCKFIFPYKYKKYLASM